MELIKRAIEERRLFSFIYDGRRREVEPHLLGYDRDGDLTLSAWQIAGETGEGWRDFHVAKLSGAAIGLTTFAGLRPGYNPRDSTLSRIVTHL